MNRMILPRLVGSIGILSFLSTTIDILVRIVVHPHVPVGIPCYDFTPVIDSLFNPHGGSSKSLNSHGVTGGECKEQGHIHGSMADLPLLAIPTSCSRVADYNPN